MTCCQWPQVYRCDQNNQVMLMEVRPAVGFLVEVVGYMIESYFQVEIIHELHQR